MNSALTQFTPADSVPLVTPDKDPAILTPCIPGRTPMKTLFAAVIALLICLPSSSRAQESADLPTFSAALEDTLVLHITKIDKETRIVTLKTRGGETLSVECGPEVKNFDKLKVGDKVQTIYKETLAIRVDKTGNMVETTEQTSTSAKKGDAPAAQFWEKREVKAKIIAIDKAAGTADIQTMDGEKFTVIPDAVENLDKVQVGNVLVVTQTSSRAISVTTPSTKTKVAKTTNTKTTTKTTTK